MGEKKNSNNIRVFIDANRYIALFKANPSLEYLNKLYDLISDKEFELIFPAITQSEVYRAVTAEINSGTGNGLIVTISEPPKKFNSEARKDLNKLKNQYVNTWNEENEKHEKVFRNKKAMAKMLFGKFAEKAIDLDVTNEIYKKAIARKSQLLPPGKVGDSLGDQVAWELILANCTDRELIIVSSDFDFANMIDKSKVNPLLINEWKKKSKKKLFLETDIAELIMRFDRQFVVSKSEKTKNKQVSKELESNIQNEFSYGDNSAYPASVSPSGTFIGTPTTTWVSASAIPSTSTTTTSTSLSHSSSFSSHSGICNRCGSWWSAGYNFCPNCGSRL